MSTWYEKLGFLQNPFFLDPVPPIKESMEKGFVNRRMEKNSVEGFVQLRRGKLIIFGRAGEGKSSLLNYIEYKAGRQNKYVIRIDGFKLTDRQTFVEELLHQVQLKTEDLTQDIKDKLSEKLEDLDIIELREKEAEKVKTGIEGKLSALVAAITGKFEAEESKGKEKVYYVASRMTKLERIVKELLPIIFEEMPTIVIADNLEKTQQVDFSRFITEVVDIVPLNILFATTGSLMEIDSRTMKSCYDIFDVPVLMDPLNTAKRLKEFIVGRMEAYRIDGYNLPHIKDEAIELLFDRTGGNLRETFRYCYWALQKYRKDISKSMILESIKEVDAPRFATLSEVDQRTLALLAEGKEKTVKDVVKDLQITEGRLEPETARLRLENLVNVGFASKKIVKSGRTYMSTYSIPKALKSILKPIKKKR